MACDCDCPIFRADCCGQFMPLCMTTKDKHDDQLVICKEEYCLNEPSSF